MIFFAEFRYSLFCQAARLPCGQVSQPQRGKRNKALLLIPCLVAVGWAANTTSGRRSTRYLNFSPP